MLLREIINIINIAICFELLMEDVCRVESDLNDCVNDGCINLTVRNLFVVSQNVVHVKYTGKQNYRIDKEFII